MIPKANRTYNYLVMEKDLKTDALEMEGLILSSFSEARFVSAVNLGIQSMNALQGLPIEQAFDEIRSKTEAPAGSPRPINRSIN